MSDGDYEEKQEGGRLIKSVSRLFEISIVSFPADGKARVVEVRSEDIDNIKSIRELEGFLRDAGGFSKSVAASLIAKTKQLVKLQRESEEEQKAVEEIVKRLKALETTM